MTTDAIKGVEEAAEFLGKSRKTVQWHITHGNLVQNPDGSFFRAELERFLARKKNPREKDLKEKKTAAELRYRLARARKEEILLAREKGELIPISAIMEQWGRRVTELKIGLTAWANKLPPLVHEKGLPEIKEIVEAEVWHILDRFAREGTWGDPSAPSVKNTGRSRK